MASKKEPPFFNEDNVGSCHCKLTFYETMELFIETLTGTCFELRVSPFETVISVKAKIQRLEGIPVSQQHLIWNNVELEDDYSLNDYHISEGCTLKLILAMRGGPINTKRVPLEDPIKEIAEYMGPCRDDVWEKVPSSKHVTFLVYQEGDQLNFFRVVDRGDGTLTPLSESLNGGSVYNLYDDEDTEISPSGQQIIENSITMNKMKLLKAKMENMNLNKKPKIKMNPHPPVVLHPSSGSLAAVRHNFLRALPHIGQSCLPPENLHKSGISQNAFSALAHTGKKVSRNFLKENDKWESISPSQSINSSTLPSKVSCVDKGEAKLSENHVVPQVTTALANLEKNAENGTSSNERCPFLYPDLTNVNLYTAEKNVLPNKETLASVSEETCNDSHSKISGTEEGNTTLQLPQEHQNKSITKTFATAENSIFNSHEFNLKKTRLSPLHCSSQMAHYSPQKSQAHSKYFEEAGLRPTISPNILQSLEVNSLTDSSYSRTSRFHGIGLDLPSKRTDTHSKVETRDITEVAIKASKDPVSVNNISLLSSFTRSTNRDGLQNSCGTNRFRTSGISLTTNFQHFQEESFRTASPHNDMPGYFLSSGVGSNGNIVTSGKRMAGDTTHLPPVNCSIQPKKKIAKHCFLCGKKTGLATSYEYVETTFAQLIAMQRLTPVLMTTRTQEGDSCRTPILLSVHQSFPKSKHNFMVRD
ncbi:AN1-type zinc finger protein 4 isoform X1 [Crotalus tigris]|uniref:AN1-type zinc finger protein 4 isoform X1 n=2 Tax=Crotalus tigris TaxID=88082 RepID=UPI00192F5747|nr:AN1-type zinc finger protein 4 isoform X1 [Crotalus tigris]XP_039193624.1 AN1-type zinc finger protein 4 isoform X1 [Crotalus tigris]XP_039193625.1 AN1-type zinc finger protein 4 isoform X1 [Crotalus tigris]